MEKIFILGNENSRQWGSSIGNVIDIPIITVNDYAGIHDFVVSNIKNLPNDGKIIIDLDATEPAVALNIALHIRLSVIELRERVLLPILLVSYLPLQSFLSLGECSEFFLTRSGYAFCNPQETNINIDALQGILPEDYVGEFLNQIHISPDANVGTHSMANQWGADVLNRLISKNDNEETEDIKDAKKKLYYKYVFLHTVKFEDIIQEKNVIDHRRNEMFLATQKKVLLIDDEADKGWEMVIRKWLHGASIDVVNNTVKNFEELPLDIKKKINDSFYDLYLLDLRLLGTIEDNIYDTNDFSGMKVLKKIKSINRGNQVIIMTASNKAWNMKALLDEGADGYYIKESPELQLPQSFSEANFQSFRHDVQLAFNSGYKKKIFITSENIIKTLASPTNINGNLANEIDTSLRSALNQILTAKKKNEFAFAFLTLFQIIEMICNEYVTIDTTTRSADSTTWIIDGNLPLYEYDTGGHSPVRGQIVSKEHPSIRNRITAILIDLCQETNCTFFKNNIDVCIDRRNAFVHKDAGKLSDPQIAKVFQPEGFQHLLQTVEHIIMKLK